MKLEDSPSLDEYKDGLPEPPVDPSAQRKRFRIILLILFLVVLLLAGFNFMKSQTAGLLTGTGVVKGAVVDEKGAPFQGKIFILGTSITAATDSNGRFQLDRVPAGRQSLIVADSLVGREFPIDVIAGQTVDLGQIQFVPTAVP